MIAVLHTLGAILRHPAYLVLSLGVAGAMLLLAIWLPNLSLVGDIIVGSKSVGEKLMYLWRSLGAFQTNFSSLSRVLTVAVALLFGANVSVFVYYVRHRIAVHRSAGVGIGGMISGVLGVGCAACGSVILSAIFGVGATAGTLAALPLHGQELSIIGVVVLAISLIVMARKAHNPFVC